MNDLEPNTNRHASPRGAKRALFLALFCATLLSACFTPSVVSDIRITGEAVWRPTRGAEPPLRAVFVPIPAPKGRLHQLPDAKAELGGLTVEVLNAGYWFTHIDFTNRSPEPLGVYLGDARMETNFYPGEHPVWNEPYTYTINNKPAYPTAGLNAPLPPTPSPVWVQPGEKLGYAFLTRSIQTPYGRSDSWGLVTDTNDAKILVSAVGNQVVMRIPVVTRGQHGELELTMRAAEERARTLWR